MRKLVALLMAAMLVVPTFGVQAQTRNDATTKALAYIRSQQAADGTFAGFGAGSTADAVYALVAAGENPATFSNGGSSAVAGLQKLAPDAAKSPGLAAKFVVALLLVGQSPKLANGTDLLGTVEQAYTSATGQYGTDVSTHAYAMLALRAADRAAATKSEPRDALKKLQLPDGGWSFDGTAATGSDTNTTALALQALIAVEGKSDAVSKALAYLKTQQNSDAGFPFSQASSFGTASDANSTANVIQALVAAGEDLQAYAKNGKTPVDRLQAFQNASGAFRYQDTPPDDNAGATYQALPALLSKPLPLAPLPQPTPGPTAAPQSTPASGSIGLPNTGVPATPLWPLVVLGTAGLIGGLQLRRRSASTR